MTSSCIQKSKTQNVEFRGEGIEFIQKGNFIFPENICPPDSLQVCSFPLDRDEVDNCSIVLMSWRFSHPVGFKFDIDLLH